MKAPFSITLAILLVSSHGYSQSRCELPQPLLRYEQSGDELLCWLYCSHTVLEYYGKVGSKWVPTKDETSAYGNGGLNQELSIWGDYGSEDTRHTVQEILCDLGGIYSVPIDGQIKQSRLESEICEKRPVVMIIDNQNSDVTHLVTAYRAGTSPLNSRGWVDYVDPLLNRGRALVTRDDLNNTQGSEWAYTLVMLSTPGQSCECAEKPGALVRDLQKSLIPHERDAGATHEECATTWCPTGSELVTNTDGTCSCESEFEREYHCDNSEEPIYRTSYTDVKVNLYEIGRRIVDNNTEYQVSGQATAKDACDRYVYRLANYSLGLVRFRVVLKVDWGDGNESQRFSSLTHTPSHTYSSSGTYPVVIKMAKMHFNKEEYWNVYNFSVTVTSSEHERKEAIVRHWRYPAETETIIAQLSNGNRVYAALNEVTQYDYVSLVRKTPFEFWDEGAFNNPAETVTWYDAIIYCNRKSVSEGFDPVYSYEHPVFNADGWCIGFGSLTADHSKNGYRLPTKDEWQQLYLAGAPANTYGQYWSSSDQSTDYAWFQDNASSATHDVGGKLPNNWGLHDMAGNVGEWVWDGPSSEKAYFCGGSYNSPNNNIGYDRGSDFWKNYGGHTVGFRVVRKAPPDLTPILQLLLLD